MTDVSKSKVPEVRSGVPFVDLRACHICLVRHERRHAQLKQTLAHACTKLQLSAFCLCKAPVSLKRDWSNIFREALDGEQVAR